MNTFSKEIARPLLVGITGGIGSGKTTVSKVFEALGVPVFNSDTMAREIVDTDVDVIAQIRETFGEGIYHKGKLDRLAMAGIVFNDASALKSLNAIVHPKVGDYFNDWVKQHANEAILLKEASILIESGSYKLLDNLILVTAPDLVRIKRVMNRDKTTKQEVLKRMSAQMSDSEKITYCDFEIKNDEGNMVIPQVLSVFDKLKEKAMNT